MTTEKNVSLFDKVSKLVGSLANDGIVSFEDSNGQTRNVKLESLCDKFEIDPDATIESLGLTVREALKRAVKSMASLKNPQEFALVLSGYAALGVTPKVYPEGYALDPYGESYNETIKQIVDDLKITDGRGRKKSSEKVITEI